MIQATGAKEEFWKTGSFIWVPVQFAKFLKMKGESEACTAKLEWNIFVDLVSKQKHCRVCHYAALWCFSVQKSFFCFSLQTGCNDKVTQVRQEWIALKIKPSFMFFVLMYGFMFAQQKGKNYSPFRKMSAGFLVFFRFSETIKAFICQ